MEWLNWLALGGLAVGAIALATAAHVTFWRRLFRVDRGHGESHRVTTADGWTLPLYRYPPVRDGGFRSPVLLCHGLGVNHLNMDYPAPFGLAQHLAAEGHDVFVLSLRGTAGSLAPARAGPIDFDAFCALDAPAAIEHVKAISGAAQVAWVGHSMGGMIAFALGGTEAADSLACLVAVGSPSGFRHQPRLAWIARNLGWIGGIVGLPGLPARVAAPWSGFFTPPLVRPIVLPGAIEGHVIRRFLAHGIERVPAPLIAQFASWAAHDRFTSRDGAIDYRARMAAHRAPALLLSGSHDGLVPPACVAEAHERLGPREKRCEALGRATGLKEDYGHGDLLLGRTAAAEVFPKIAAFLRERIG